MCCMTHFLSVVTLFHYLLKVECCTLVVFVVVFSETKKRH